MNTSQFTLIINDITDTDTIEVADTLAKLINSDPLLKTYYFEPQADGKQVTTIFNAED